MQRLVSGWWLATLVVAVAVLTACVTSTSSSVRSGEGVALRGADYSGSGPGSLVSATTIPNIDESIPLGVNSIRVVYRSTSGVDGSRTTVSGAVFVPPGRPPAGGWPVVAFAHGTTGFNPECGPSLTADLMGSAEGIAPFLREGFAVAAADYQGLGSPGAHPYLDAKTAAFNVIDSVRALRAVTRDVSSTWAAFGGSQGGAAVWAANEQASTYAPELHLVGTLSVVPAADMSGLAAGAAAQTLTEDQLAMYIGILRGLERTRPTFRIDDYRRGSAADDWETLNACTGQQAVDRTALLDQLPPSTLVPATPQAQQVLFDLLAAMALPQQPASAPMLVIYAGQDEFIPTDATRRAIERACAMGGQIEAIFQPDKGHGDVDYSGYVQWLTDRLEGRPAVNSCPS